MKRSIFAIPLAALVLSIGLSAPALAYETTSGDQVSVDKERTVYGSYYAAGNSLTIDGDVTGDLICAARTVTVNGSVGGDVLCAAETVTINGPVAGDVRVAASDLVVNDRVEGNVNALVNSLVTGRDADIGGSVMSQSASTRLNGRIGGEAYGNTGTVALNGAVAGRVRFAAETVTVGSDARLGAGLDYTSRNDAEVAKGAEITGETTRHDVPKPQPRPAGEIVAAWLTSLLTAIATGLLILWLWPRAARGTAARFTKRPGTLTLVGLVALLLTPVVAVIVMITAVGLPAGLILLGAWLAALYVARIVAGLALGSALQRRFAPKAVRGRYGWATLGLMAAWVVFAIPVVGAIASIMAMLVGLGAITLAARDHIDREDRTTTPPTAA